MSRGNSTIESESTMIQFVHESGPSSRGRPPRKGKGNVTASSIKARATRHSTRLSQPRSEPNSAARKRSHDDSSDGSVVSEDGGIQHDANGEPTPKKRRGRKRNIDKDGDEESELVTIVPNMVAMSDLCRDRPRGRISEREKAMRKIDWAEVKRRRREQDLAAAQPRGEGEERSLARPAMTGGPEMETRIVDGQMVFVNADTVQAVNRHADAVAEEQALEAVEEDDLTNFVNRSSWINQNRRDPADRVTYKGNRKWTTEQTDEFYEALRMVGTDFYMLSKMLPGRSRREVKAKFVREERIEPDRVQSCLVSHSIPMDLERYREKTGQEEMEFEDPEEVQREIDRERARMMELADRARTQTVDTGRRRGADGDDGGEGADREGELEPPKRGRKAGEKKKAKAIQKMEEVEILGLIED